MSTFPAEWALCGGWAADAWLGSQSRSHGDLDITVFQDDQRAIFEHLAGWQLIGHDNNVAGDSDEPWDGRWLDLPAHIHARAHVGFDLEVILNERSARHWIFHRERALTAPLSQCIQRSPWGLPTVAPEVILYYKANPPAWRDTPPPPLRPHDELDLLALLPHLTGEQCSWIREAISRIHPGHPWLAQLSG